MATIKLRAYDVRISCEFAITSLEEERKLAINQAIEESVAATVKARMHASTLLFGWSVLKPKEVNVTEIRKAVAMYFEAKSREGAVPSPAWEVDIKLQPLKTVKAMAEYVGDNTLMDLTSEDFELLQANLPPGA
jgi:hypothetical protein